MNLRRHPEDVFSVAWEGCMTNSNKQRNDIGRLPGQDHLYLGSAPVGEEHLDAATADVERPPQASLVELLRLMGEAVRQGEGEALLSELEGLLSQLQPVEAQLMTELRNVLKLRPVA
jgi:hypothetical protein